MERSVRAVGTEYRKVNLPARRGNHFNLMDSFVYGDPMQQKHIPNEV